MFAAFLLSMALDASLREGPPRYERPVETIAECVTLAAEKNATGALAEGRMFFCARIVFPD